MPIIDVQRRIQEAGRIRIGKKAANGYPQKLDTFRLTSPNRDRIEAAAQVFGGDVAEWDGQWEVITTSDVLDVVVPPQDMAFSQWYEVWSAAGCQRRCDGQWDVVNDQACICDPEDRACDPHTRLSLMLPDVPGLGVWRLDTQGWNAATELAGAVQVCQAALARGTLLPARLRLEQRESRKPGQPVRRFVVPVLDVEISVGQLLSGSQAPALESGEVEDGTERLDQAMLTPVPDDDPEPVRSVADQVADVEEGPTAYRSGRSNAAQPVRPSGLTPRKAADAEQGASPPKSEHGQLLDELDGLLTEAEAKSLQPDRQKVVDYASISPDHARTTIDKVRTRLDEHGSSEEVDGDTRPSADDEPAPDGGSPGGNGQQTGVSTDDAGSGDPPEGGPSEVDEVDEVAQRLVNEHTRDQLDVMASEVGVDDPDQLPNKAAVAAAIVAATGGREADHDPDSPVTKARKSEIARRLRAFDLTTTEDRHAFVTAATDGAATSTEEAAMSDESFATVRTAIDRVEKGPLEVSYDGEGTLVLRDRRAAS